VLSVWNLLGRRDNKYKARIKITIHEEGIDRIKSLVEERFKELKPSFGGFDQTLLEDIKTAFSLPDSKQIRTDGYISTYERDKAFRTWVDMNTAPHKQGDHAIATVSLKAHGQTPGDASAEQMHILADIAKELTYNELRVSHEQNIVLPHVHKSDLPEVYQRLVKAGLATANIGLISDIIACPGMDYCALANYPLNPDSARNCKSF